MTNLFTVGGDLVEIDASVEFFEGLSSTREIANENLNGCELGEIERAVVLENACTRRIRMNGWLFVFQAICAHIGCGFLLQSQR